LNNRVTGVMAADSDNNSTNHVYGSRRVQGLFSNSVAQADYADVFLDIRFRTLLLAGIWSDFKRRGSMSA
jgi:hypothetical protein